MKDVSGMVLEILRFFCLQEGWLSHPVHLDCLKLQKQRRLKNLIDVSGLADELVCSTAIIPANEDELVVVHTSSYIEDFKRCSAEQGGDLGCARHLALADLKLPACQPVWSDRRFLPYLTVSLTMPMPCRGRLDIIACLIFQMDFVC